ncbi:MAG: SufD family Fe-S cluster assembly protein [Candidatus Pacebacteria bacterium]|nr:SufD family Fe-S cluster assembly protein [Candidatus Paceibacterota bacterium]
MEKVKYGLKIYTDFKESEIKERTRIINIDEAKHLEIKEENFENDFLSHIIINLNVAEASVKFIGRYRAEKSLCDISCVINHKADYTKSEIDIKGIAEAEGKIISRSNIFVDEDVKGAEGEEKVKFIFVVKEGGEAGEIDAIPNLDINSHDVKVSHALSISKIKETDIWYANLHSFDEKESEVFFKENFLN